MRRVWDILQALILLAMGGFCLWLWIHIVAMFWKASPWAGITVAVVSVLPLLWEWWRDRRKARARLAEAEEDPGERLRQRIAHVNAAFTEAATLMYELQRDLQAQNAAREALIAQAEEQQRLLAVNTEQAEQIRQILIGEAKATIHAERRQQWMFFFLGALVSIPIGVAVNLLVP